MQNWIVLFFKFVYFIYYGKYNKHGVLKMKTRGNDFWVRDVCLVRKNIKISASSPKSVNKMGMYAPNMREVNYLLNHKII